MICSVCKQEKPEEEFRVQKIGRKLYPLGKCRSCENAYSRTYRKNNPSYVKAAKTWKDSNKERVKKVNSSYRQTHPEKERERSRRYSKTEKGRIRSVISSEKRRVFKINNGGSFSVSEWKHVCNKYGNICLCCGRSDVKLSIDHVIPLRLGGKHSVENIQPLCRSCNSKKHLKIIDYREGV